MGFFVCLFFSPVGCCHAVDQADLELAVLLEICVFKYKTTSLTLTCVPYIACM